MPLQAPRVQGSTLKRPFEERVRHGRTPKWATKGVQGDRPLERKNRRKIRSLRTIKDTQLKQAAVELGYYSYS